MIPEMTDSHTAPDGREFARVERILKTRLPPGYASFIRTHNGGRPIPDSFPIRTLDTEGMVDKFLCILKDDPYDLIIWRARYYGRVPGELTPIALDPGGNLICLGIRSEYQGRVYFWDHENEAAESQQPWFQNVFLIADHFKEFINSFG